MLQLDNILKGFQKTKDELEEYKVQCDQEREVSAEKLRQAKEEIRTVDANKLRASQALKQVKKIVG